MRLLICVVTLVNSQISCPRETLLTEATFVRLDAHVTSHMNHKVVVPDESKSTL